MVLKNMQSVATFSANIFGVNVTATESGSKRAYGKRQAHFLSLPWRPQPGLMRNPSEPDANMASCQRAGRSGAYAGGHPSTRSAKVAVSLRETGFLSRSERSTKASRAALAKRLARVDG